MASHNGNDTASSSPTTDTASTTADDVSSPMGRPQPLPSSSTSQAGPSSRIPSQSDNTASAVAGPSRILVPAVLPSRSAMQRSIKHQLSPPKEEQLGCSYGPDGQLLIGGLAVDGSAAGETGWASPAMLAGPSTTSWKSSAASEVETKSARWKRTGRRAKKPDKSLHTCLPAEGNPTFGYGAEDLNNTDSASTTAEQSTTLRGRRMPAQAPLSPPPLRPRESKIAVPGTPAVQPVEGVKLADIVEGRTCRPIALIDLRTYLVTHYARQDAMIPPGSALGAAALPDLEKVLGNAPGSIQSDDAAEKIADLTPTPPMSAAAAEKVTPGELNAVNFVVAFDRYVRRFRKLSLQDMDALPTPATLEATMTQWDWNAPTLAPAPSHDPTKQAMRERFTRLVETYLGQVGVHVGSLNVPKPSKPISPRASYRLTWMVELGLIDENALNKALAEAALTTDPAILLPLVNLISRWLDANVIPPFMAHASRNLSGKTTYGRFTMGLIVTGLALLTSILLILAPSDGAIHVGRIPRWWRIMTFPLWAMGLGYFIAAGTGVCVWLSLRGNREPGLDEDEVRSRRSSGGSFGDVVDGNADNDERTGEDGNIDSANNSNWLMAPEVRKRLLPFVPASWNFEDGKAPPPFAKQRDYDDGSVTSLGGSPRAFRTRSRSVPDPSKATGDEKLTTTLSTSGSMPRSLSGARSNLAPVDEDGSPTSKHFDVEDGDTDKEDLNLGPPALDPLSEDAEVSVTTSSATPAARPLAEPIRAGLPSAVQVASSPVAAIKTKKVALPGLDLSVRTVSTISASTNLSTSGRPSMSHLRSMSRGSVLSPTRSRAASWTAATAVEEGSAPGPNSSGPSSITIGPLQERSLHPAPRRTTKHHMRLWSAIQQRSGFAVATEKVRDERIRMIHLRRAFKALVGDFIIAAIATIVVVAIP